MSQFAAAQRGVAGTASGTQLNNGTLTQLTAGIIAGVKAVSWGGSDTSLVAQSVRWARVSNTPATPTSIATPQPTTPGTVAGCSLNTYSTTPTGAASPAGLFSQDWNSQGGGGVLVLPIGGEWYVTGGALGTTYNQIGCGNVVGASANTSFGWIWFE
jgi:hypothetical protein